MNEWLSYFVLALLATGGWLLLGYLVRKSYNSITEGKR